MSANAGGEVCHDAAAVEPETTEQLVPGATAMCMIAREDTVLFTFPHHSKW